MRTNVLTHNTMDGAEGDETSWAVDFFARKKMGPGRALVHTLNRMPRE